MGRIQGPLYASNRKNLEVTLAFQRPEPIFVSEALEANLEFSVISLVRNEESYERLLNSFARNGFSADNTEFLAIDNRDENSFDGFSAIRATISGLRGRHVLYTHDDIELTKAGIAELRAIIENLEKLDSKWMISGNAGGLWHLVQSVNARILHLDDPHGSFRHAEGGPIRVNSLDENFLVMPRNRMPLPSLDLSGFHLFATDMCLQAQAAGGSCYVIPFELFHHGAGLADGMFPEAQAALEKKYVRLGYRGRLRTPAGRLNFGLSAKVFHRLHLLARLSSKIKKRIL